MKKNLNSKKGLYAYVMTPEACRELGVCIEELLKGVDHLKLNAPSFILSKMLLTSTRPGVRGLKKGPQTTSLTTCRAS